MRQLILIPLVMLAACSEEEPTDEERAARMAEIERINEGVAMPIEPEKILYPDIERAELFGASCAFAPEGGGMAPILLAMEDAAHMKIGGEIVSFAPDAGVRKGPQVAWTKYDGRAASLNLGLGKELGQTGDGGVVRYEARLTLRDGHDRVVYDAPGEAQCGA